MRLPVTIIANQVITIHGDKGISCDITSVLVTRSIVTREIPANAINAVVNTCGRR